MLVGWGKVLSQTQTQTQLRIHLLSHNHTTTHSYTHTHSARAHAYTNKQIVALLLSFLDYAEEVTIRYDENARSRALLSISYASITYILASDPRAL
jgi:23S rRNA maturation mini-RNase III